MNKLIRKLAIISIRNSDFLSLGLFFLFFLLIFFFLSFLFGLDILVFGYIEFESEGVIAAEIVIVHSSGFEEAKFGIKVECS
jgi:hypothetical protein